MKKIVFSTLFIVILCMFTSCDLNIDIPGMFYPTPDDNKDNNGEIPENYVNDNITFDRYEQVMIVVSPEKTDFAYNASQAVSEITGVSAITVTDDYDGKFPNELVLGRCNREVSKEAYTHLDNIEKAHLLMARYVIYSQGNSVCIAFDETPGYNHYIINCAIEIFTSKYATASPGVNMKAGEICEGSIDISEYQKSLDREQEEKYWEIFESEAGAEATAVLREMYEKMYSDKLADWLANLYDPEIGGFYYSNSARDNDKVYYNGAYYDLLPDIESTSQAAGFLTSSGLLYGINNLQDALPDLMKESLIKFLKERQDKNGYFYHPQWTKAMVDAQLSRRGRDLSNAVSLLKQLGSNPTYNTPTGVRGDGLLWNGTPVSFITQRIKTGVAEAVSYVVSTASAVPSHLKDETSFRNYLNNLDIKGNSYWVGNQLASQATQIKARDAVLRGEGANYSLVEILHEWMDKNCDPTTGNWSGRSNYAGLNGLMKISSVYQTLNIALPYPEASVKSAIATIDTDEYNSTVCFAYNSWFAICNIINNVKSHRPPSESMIIVEKIVSDLRARAPELIRATLEKQMIFLCSDGSFSYTERSSSHTSQGLPVAIYGTKEGDVNATVICTTGTLKNMFNALGYTYVPILYRNDFNRMLAIIEENRNK